MGTFPFSVSRALAALAATARRHPVFGFLALGLWAVVALVIIVSQKEFDSEILNLLPADAPAVQGLKLVQQDFPQARELAFFFESPEDPEVLADFRAFFLERLGEEPWAIRWVAGNPMEAPNGHATLAPFVGPLLLNLPPEEFAESLSVLTPEQLTRRLTDLAGRARAGSPGALLELQWDPLGLLPHVTEKVGATAGQGHAFTLTSPDGSAQIISVITRLPTLDAAACRDLMLQVRAFVEETRSAFGEGAPEVGVTGRSAYVDEISASMRRDILFTSAVSAVGISLIFLLGYGGLRPLFGLLSLLLLSALTALALGALLFPAMNLLAIAFCSILFGLGVDFGLLLLEELRRQGQSHPAEAVRQAVLTRWPGILGVALTTAVGFLALIWGNSEGFRQLGILTALGIGACALLLPIGLFLFLPARDFAARPAPPPPRLLRFLLERGSLSRWIITLIALALIPAALLPWGELGFDTSPHSLEPRKTPAARTLQQMMRAFPGVFEPMLAVVPYDDPTKARQLAATMEARFARWQEEGLLIGYSSASALLLDPERWQENAALGQAWDWDATHTALRTVLATTGLRWDSASGGAALLRYLQNAQEPTWNDLPEDSPWWFLLDRTLSRERPLFLYYLQPSNPEEAEGEILERLRTEFPEVWPTGWTVMLEELRPWAERELRLFCFGVTGVIFVLLLGLYRSLRLWLTHLVLFLLSAALLVTLLRATGLKLNLLNVLAFPLLIGVGVDYATHLLLALRRGTAELAAVYKPVFLAGLTTLCGFGALSLAENPALSGLGMVCLLGVGSCLVVTCLLLPLWAPVIAPVSGKLHPASSMCISE